MISPLNKIANLMYELVSIERENIPHTMFFPFFLAPLNILMYIKLTYIFLDSRIGISSDFNCKEELFESLNKASDYIALGKIRHDQSSRFNANTEWQTFSFITS